MIIDSIQFDIQLTIVYAASVDDVEDLQEDESVE